MTEPKVGVPLTASEVQLLVLIAAGKTFDYIAAQFKITNAYTMRSRARYMYRKLGANCAAQAVMRGVQGGWLDPITGAGKLIPTPPLDRLQVRTNATVQVRKVLESALHALTEES